MLHGCLKQLKWNYKKFLDEEQIMTYLLLLEKIASGVRKLPYLQFQDENFTLIKR